MPAVSTPLLEGVTVRPPSIVGGFRAGKHTRDVVPPTYERRMGRVKPPARPTKGLLGRWRANVDVLVGLRVLSAVDSAVAAALAEKAPANGVGPDLVSQTVLGREAGGLSAEVARRSLKRLRAVGVLDWSHQIVDGSPAPCAYVLLPRVEYSRKRRARAGAAIGPAPNGRAEYAAWSQRVLEWMLNPPPSEPGDQSPNAEEPPAGGRWTGPCPDDRESVYDKYAPPPPADESVAAMEWVNTATVDELLAVATDAGLAPAMLERVERRTPGGLSAVAVIVEERIVEGRWQAGPAP